MPYLPSLSPTTIPHLATLLSTPTGLDATLATTCYASLFLHTQLNLLAPSPLLKPKSALLSSNTPKPSRLQALYTTLESHRILTRLFSLPSLLTTALKTYNTQHRDPAIKTFLYAGLASGLVFQVLENFALLVQSGVIRGEKARKWEGWCWVVSNRFWLAQLVCEMGRLGRSWQMGWKEEFGAEEVDVVEVAGKESETEVVGKGGEVWGEKSVDAGTQELVQSSARELVKVQSKELEKRWWRELYVTACSIPLAVHWSFAEGQSPVSEALFAGSGLVTGVVTLKDAWEETA